MRSQLKSEGDFWNYARHNEREGLVILALRNRIEEKQSNKYNEKRTDNKNKFSKYKKIVKLQNTAEIYARKQIRICSRSNDMAWEKDRYR